MKVKQREYELCPAGLQPAKCIKVEDLGAIETPYGIKDKVRLVFELELNTKEGPPFKLSRRFTRSLFKKAALRQCLESWLGRELTEEQLNGSDDQGYELNDLIGFPGNLIVKHVKGDNGLIAVIDGVAPYGDQAPPPAPTTVTSNSPGA